jgi:hypothetical protein
MHGQAGLFERAASVFYANGAGAYQAAYPKAGGVQRILLGAVGRSAYIVYAAPHHVDYVGRQLCRWLG